MLFYFTYEIFSYEIRISHMKRSEKDFTCYFISHMKFSHMKSGFHILFYFTYEISHVI